MDIKEVRREFGDCDWMRAVLNNYTVSAVLWLMDKVEELDQTIEIFEQRKAVVGRCPNCGVEVGCQHLMNCHRFGIFKD